MLYITADNRSIGMHIGEKRPLNFSDIVVETATSVTIQADGDELETILRGVHNIPIASNNTVMKWTGDNAKFIILNLF